MNALWLLTKKNLRLLIRAKGSALIVVFAPLLIILLLGLSFNNSAKYGLNIGIYAATYNDDVNSFINKLQEDEFKIIKYSSSINDCIEDVKSGVTHTCISLPESFQIEGNTQKEITFYVDPSKINLVWMIQQTLETKLNLQSGEITQSLTQDMLSRIGDAKSKVSTEKDQVSGVKQKDSDSATKVESVSFNLKTLDLAAPVTVYNLNASNEFKTNITATLTTGLTNIATAKSALSSSNISSSDKSKVSKALTDANNELLNAQALLESSTSGGYGTVTALITSLQTDVDAAKTKLTTVKQQVTSSAANMDAVKASLSESVAQLESIQKVLDEVNTNLNAQKVTDAKVITSPLITKIEKITPTGTYLNYMFPALMVLVIMFSSLLLGTTLVMMEKNSPAFTRNFFIPVRKITFVLATYLTNLILILIQVIIILGISWIFLKDISTVFLPLALVLFLTASVFTFLGMALGYLFSSEETAVLASISLGSILLFVSGLIIPLESVSLLFRNITYFNPFVIAEKLVREVFIFNSPFASLLMDLGLLLIYALVLFLLILIIESLMHKQLVNKFFHHHHMQRKKDKGEKKEV